MKKSRSEYRQLKESRRGQRPVVYLLSDAALRQLERQRRIRVKF